MIKFLTTSILLRVAVVQTALIVGALYFIAVNFSPEATFVSSSGKTRHVFLAPPFIQQVVMGWFLMLPVSYVMTRFVMWLTGEKADQL